MYTAKNHRLKEPQVRNTLFANQSQYCRECPVAERSSRNLYPQGRLCYNPPIAEFLKHSIRIDSNASSLVPAFDQQDEVFLARIRVLRAAIANRVFPAASVAVTQAGNLIALKAFGNLVYEEDLKGAPLLPGKSRESNSSEDAHITPATLFDLASVTKAIATSTMAMLLYMREFCQLDAPIVTSSCSDSSGKTDPRRHEVTFRMLLAHSSGLPAYEKLFLRAQSCQELLTAALTTPLSADPGTRAEYSDIGFIILGIALERLAGESLDAVCRREIFGRLAMSNTIFNPAAGILRRRRSRPTADETIAQFFRNRIVQGEVQDENACVLGGAAGHAGLFSTAEDVARFAHTMLNGGSPILRPETVTLFTRRDSTPGTSRALGWDTPSSPSQSGKYFSPHSFGHLGYTGTSLWIDPERQLSITLLTNRTWPDCSNQAIKQLRPKFHDALIESLEQLR